MTLKHFLFGSAGVLAVCGQAFAQQALPPPRRLTNPNWT